MKQKLLNLYYRILAFLAKKYLRKHKPYVIGINGSVGKTSCRMIIYQTLQSAFPELNVYTSKKNFNGELGLSLSIFQMKDFGPDIGYFFSALWRGFKRVLFGKKPYDVLILEYGIDRPGEMDFLVNIIKPHIGVFTAIDAVHSEQFGDPAAIANEEVKMIKNTLETAFLNQDDTYAMQLKDQVEIDAFTYQTEGYKSNADITFEDEIFTMKDRKLLVKFDLHMKKKKHTIQTNLVGKAHYGYIGVALTIAEILAHKLSLKNILGSKKGTLDLEYELQPGRMTVMPGISNSIVVDSTYNASPLSVRKIMNTVYNMKQQLFPNREVWMLLGDMRELGDLTEEEHRRLAGHIHQMADRVFFVGKEMNAYTVDELQKIGFNEDIMYTFEDSLDAGKHIKIMINDRGTGKDNGIILLAKGSQNTIFLEEALKLILEDKKDFQRLTRQSDWRMKRKEEFFEG